MDISIPLQLKQFIEKKVKNGLYSSEDEVVCDALRVLKERDAQPRSSATRQGAVSVSPYDRAIDNMGMGEYEIEAMAFIVLMQATKDMDKDLKMIMAEIKAMSSARQKMRELIARVNKDVAANAGQMDGKSPLNFKSGMGGQRAYHHAQLPFADPESDGGVKFIVTDLFCGEIENVAQLEAVQQELKGKLDGMSEMSEMTSLRLQMLMERRSKLISTLSNIMKKTSTTQDTLIQNLK